MSSIRRIYTYLLTFAGLAVFATAVANLGQLLVDILVLRPESAGGIRDAVAQNAAAAVVGVAAWLVHWAWLTRSARRDAAERASTLRRLFVYGVLATSTLACAIALHQTLNATFDALLAVGSMQLDRVLRPLPYALIAALAWLGHWRLASADRVTVGEANGSATLRRWYLFGIAFVGGVVLLAGLAGVVEALWRLGVAPAGRAGPAIATSAASTLVGLGLWVGHWRVLRSRLPAWADAEDQRAILCSVYLFLVLFVAVDVSLYAASQLLYYAVARLLGVNQPGGVGGDLWIAAAGPASLALVYGAAWAYQRAAVQGHAGAFGAEPRQIGIRRLYTYVVAFVGLDSLVTGAAGLLWTVGDLTLAGPNRETWNSQAALFATLACVGLPVWALHWKAVVDGAEARALSRRLYLYVTLIVAALAIIVSLAAALYRLIAFALGAPFGMTAELDLSHAAAVASVAACLAVYHWRTIQADSARAAREPSDSKGTEATIRIRAADDTSLASALETLRATGVEVHVR